MPTSAYPVVVIGAGQCGLQICDSLRKGGYDGRLILIGEETALPYQRPPLSKKFLLGDLEPERLLFRPASYYDKLAVEVRLGERVLGIDRERHALTLASGEHLHYARLALATGARVRPLSCAGADLPGIHYVRTLDDSLALRDCLARSARIGVVGGGFIGLEVAAIARQLGKSVILLEAQDRLMARAVSPLISDFYADLHRQHGVEIRLNTGIHQVARSGSGLLLETSAAEHLDVDLLVAGIGVIPNTELAADCGLACNNGIIVDGSARTSDPDIVAAGDCTLHYNGFLGRELRLESVQNAVDQAKVAAASLCGDNTIYHQVPWFWSDQYDVKLQMAGIGLPYDACVVRGEVTAAGFSVVYFRDGALVGTDSVNRAADHMAVRKLLMQGTAVSVAQAADMTVDLLQLARA